MRTLDQILELLRDIKPELIQFGVKRIGVFGSYVRGNQREDSDVDLIVVFSKPVGWEIVDIKDFLESTLGLPVDIATPKSLRTEMQETIMNEAIFVED